MLRQNISGSKFVKLNDAHSAKYLQYAYLTLYDPGGGGALKAPLSFFALTHLILELDYCALGTFPKNSLTTCGENFF